MEFFFYVFTLLIMCVCADHRDRAVSSINSLSLLERRCSGFESQSRHGCLRLLRVSAVTCVGRGLATGRPLLPRGPTNCL
jgi:hypothetical protein